MEEVYIELLGYGDETDFLAIDGLHNAREV